MILRDGSIFQLSIKKKRIESKYFVIEKGKKKLTAVFFVRKRNCTCGTMLLVGLFIGY